MSFEEPPNRTENSKILTKKVNRVFNFDFNQILTGFADKEAIFYESIKKPFPNPAFILGGYLWMFSWIKMIDTVIRHMAIWLLPLWSPDFGADFEYLLCYPRKKLFSSFFSFLLYFGIDASYEHDFVTVVKP